MKKNSFILLLTVFCAACNQRPVPDTDAIILDLNSVSAIDPKASISLQSLNWDTGLIPLDTSTEESLIREISQIEESEVFFWILADSKVLQFGKDGSFKRQIGAIGQGPEEYIAAQCMRVDEKNREIYIMDYFGRKMCVYTWDGAFQTSFPLPEDYAFDGFFRSGEGKLYFHSMANAVKPDILLYDVQTQQADTLSYREREMGMEGFMGNTTMYELNGDTYVYHYFNDTVYTIRDNRLHPAWFIAASKMTYRFEELEIPGDYIPKVWPDGPRIQMDKVIETPQYIFVFYMLDKDNALYGPAREGKYTNFMAMYDKTDGTWYPHVNIISEDRPWLSLKDGTPLYYSSYSNSLFSVKEPADLNEYNAVEGLKDDDNPVIIRYSLK